MKRTMRSVSAMIAIGALAGFAQQTPPAGRGGGQGRGGQGGRGGAPAPAVPNLSHRPTGGSLGMIRLGAADKTLWFDWHVGIPTTAFKQLTWSEALAKSDTLGVTGVEASSAQRLSPEIPKPFDDRLQAGERAAILRRLRELNQAVFAWRVDNLAADEAGRRKAFDFAKAVNIPVIVTGADASDLAGLEKLADEYGVMVALESKDDPKNVMKALEGRGKRMGVAADIGAWTRMPGTLLSLSMSSTVTPSANGS